MNKVFLTLAMLLPQIVWAVTIDEIFADTYGAWELPYDKETKRWAVINNLDSAKEEGIFHIEVLARKKGDEPWQVQRLKYHMAITHEAFIKDLVQPTKGKVHPDSYVGEYRAWLKSTEKAICNKSVLQCLK